MSNTRRRRSWRIETGGYVRAPIDIVFDYVARPGNAPAWQKGVFESGLVGVDEISEGVEGYEIRKFLGRRFESTYRFVHYDPPRSVICEGVSLGQLLFRTGMLCAEQDQGTDLKMWVEVEDRGGFIATLFRLALPLVLRMARRQADGDLGRLRRALEP